MKILRIINKIVSTFSVLPVSSKQSHRNGTIYHSCPYDSTLARTRMKYFARFSSMMSALLLLLGAGQEVYATHILGGEIRAESVSCQGFTYRVTVVLYGDTGSDFTFESGVLSLGFGDPIDVGTETDFSVVRVNNDGATVNTLVFERAFPGPGTYLINFRSFNRNDRVANIASSVNTPFYTETKLVISPQACNSTPVLSDTLNTRAYAESRYEMLINATDPDGDSLSVELVTPREDVDLLVRGYRLPIDYDLGLLNNPVASDGVSRPTFNVSPEALVWDAPNLGGSFIINVRVNEWRKVNGTWVALGYVTRDLLIEVVDTVNQTDVRDLIVTDTEEAFAEPDAYLYPNPTSGPFSLEINNDRWVGGTATLYNIIGEALSERVVAPGSNSYDVSNFTSGIYFINLRQDEMQKILRFMKR